MNPMIRDSMLGWPGLLSTPRSPPPPKQWPPRVEWVNANEIPSSDTKHYACPLDLLFLICVNEALKTAREQASSEWADWQRAFCSDLNSRRRW